MDTAPTPNWKRMRLLVGLGIAMMLISLPGALGAGGDPARWGPVTSGASIALIGASALVPAQRRILLAVGLGLGVTGLVLAFL